MLILYAFFMRYELGRFANELRENLEFQTVPYGRLSSTCNRLRVPHISLVFCEMWDTTKLDLSCPLAVESLRI